MLILATVTTFRHASFLVYEGHFKDTFKDHRFLVFEPLFAYYTGMYSSNVSANAVLEGRSTLRVKNILKPEANYRLEVRWLMRNGQQVSSSLCYICEFIQVKFLQFATI